MEQAATWNDLVTELAELSGLLPDPGRDVIIEGQLDSEGWLLQNTDQPEIFGEPVPSGPGSDELIGGLYFPLPQMWRPDSCIELADDRACLGSTSEGPWDARATYDRTPDGTPREGMWFEVGLVKPEPAVVRMTTDQRIIDVEPKYLSDSRVRVYVFALRPGEVPLTREYFDAFGGPLPNEVSP